MAALQMDFTLEHLIVFAYPFKINLSAVGPLDDVEPRLFSGAASDYLQFFARQKSEVLTPRLDPYDPWLLAAILDPNACGEAHVTVSLQFALLSFPPIPPFQIIEDHLIRLSTLVVC